MVSEDFLTIDLMAAYENLGLIIGEEIEDDLANRIFSKFCMPMGYILLLILF